MSATEVKSAKPAHACMGLNECKQQGGPRLENRKDEAKAPYPAAGSCNSCAGQGWCATASFHSCHTNNECAGQGGCGLYGWEPELARPGTNSCQSMGSCAVPVNAERFVTDGPHRGESVWELARAAFTEAYDKKKAADPSLPSLGDSPMSQGPTYNDYLNKYLKDVAACGSSGMSGAGSCS